MFRFAALVLHHHIVALAETCAKLICDIAAWGLPAGAGALLRSEVHGDIAERIWQDLKAGLPTGVVAANAVFHGLSVVPHLLALRAEYRGLAAAAEPEGAQPAGRVRFWTARLSYRRLVSGVRATMLVAGTAAAVGLTLANDRRLASALPRGGGTIAATFNDPRTFVLRNVGIAMLLAAGGILLAALIPAMTALVLAR
jgi:hypothetical protein